MSARIIETEEAIGLLASFESEVYEETSQAVIEAARAIVANPSTATRFALATAVASYNAEAGKLRTHCMRGRMGFDHDLDSAIAELREADEIRLAGPDDGMPFALGHRVLARKGQRWTCYRTKKDPTP